MHFFVNGQEIDITLEGEKTVGEVLRSFEETAAENKCATIGIKIDGKEISADEFDDAAAQDLKDETLVELTTVSEEAVAEAFKDSAAEISATADNLLELPALFQSGSDSKAKASIARLADALDKFCHVTAVSALFPEKFGKISAEGKSLSDFFADFMPIFNDLNGAMENGDTVLLGDLAEYEISPRLKALADAVREL